MTYNFPNKLRNLAIVFMCLGFLGLTYGFLSAPSSIKESKAMVSAIRNIEMVLGRGRKEPSESEFKNIRIARKSIVAKVKIKKGEILW